MWSFEDPADCSKSIGEPEMANSPCGILPGSSRPICDVSTPARKSHRSGKVLARAVMNGLVSKLSPLGDRPGLSTGTELDDTEHFFCKVPQIDTRLFR